MAQDTWRELATRRLEEAAEAHRLMSGLADEIAEIGALLADALGRGHKALLCGNGGSAADAQHLAAELAGRFRRERRPLPALALTTNASTVTAIANDYGYGEVFARQVRAYGRRGDVLVGISTSGGSENVVEAFRAAGEIGLVRIALVGRRGGPLADEADVCLRVPAGETARVQECHILAGHVICEIVEEACAEA